MSIDKLPILAIKNPEERSKSIEQAIAGIHNGLITLGLEYANKITGQFMSPRSEQYFQLRDSTYYRLDSLVFHLRLLRSVSRNISNSSRRSRTTSRNDTTSYMWGAISSSSYLTALSFTLFPCLTTSAI